MAKKLATGEVHAVKLGRNSHALVHVVWTKAAWKHTSVVFLDWFGDVPPTLADATRAKLLVFRHPELRGELGWLRNVHGATAPNAFTRLGRQKPSDEALAIPLGDPWTDPEQRHRTTDWRAVTDTLRRERAYRTDPKAAMAARIVPGHVVAIETVDGLAVSLVLRTQGRVEQEKYSVRYELATFAHRFEEVPTLAEATRALGLPRLRSAHELVSTSQEVPNEAIRLGLVKLPRALPTLDPHVHGSWPWSKRRERALERRRAAPAPTLSSVEPRKLFAGWTKASTADRAEARSIIAALVTTLRSVTAPSAKRAAILRAVKAFNATDFIETFEREEICAVLQALGVSSGLSPEVVDRLIEAKRDF